MQITPELLERYQLGLCTPEEKKFVEQWLDDTDYAPEDIPDKTSSAMSDAVWGALSEKITPDTAAKVIPLHKRLMRYSAAAIILFTFGLSTYYLLNNSILDKRNNEMISFEDYKVIQTLRGQKRTVKLPDGSTIRLHYETELKVPEKFANNERTVFLSGNAYFEIAKDPKRPFIIYTGNSKTQVLGTSFAIRTYKNSEETEIIVTSGKVTFSDKNKPQNLVTLTVNDHAVLKADKSIKTGKVDAQNLTAWKDNKLVFEKASLAEIIEVIEPWYDIEIVVNNPELLAIKYRLTKHNPSLTELMEHLSTLGNFDFTIDDKQVIID